MFVNTCDTHEVPMLLSLTKKEDGLQDSAVTPCFRCVFCITRNAVLLLSDVTEGGCQGNGNVTGYAIWVDLRRKLPESLCRSQEEDSKDQ